MIKLKVFILIVFRKMVGRKSFLYKGCDASQYHQFYINVDCSNKTYKTDEGLQFPRRAKHSIAKTTKYAGNNH